MLGWRSVHAACQVFLANDTNATVYCTESLRHHTQRGRERERERYWLEHRPSLGATFKGFFASSCMHYEHTYMHADKHNTQIHTVLLFSRSENPRTIPAKLPPTSANVSRSPYPSTRKFAFHIYTYIHTYILMKSSHDGTYIHTYVTLHKYTKVCIPHMYLHTHTHTHTHEIIP